MIGDEIRAGQRDVVGRGLGVGGKSEGQSTAASMCSIFARRHEVIEFDIR